MGGPYLSSAEKNPGNEVESLSVVSFNAGQQTK